MSSGGQKRRMASETEIRRLVAADAPAYKRLRDDMLDGFPDAFTSDAETERAKPDSAYIARFEAEGDPARFSFGAWCDGQLVGAITCERDARVKVRHIGHIVGMMVSPAARGQGVGAALLSACIACARQAGGMEMLTLSVTSTNSAARSLYAKAGFRGYGLLQRAVKLGDAYLEKELMALTL